MDEHRHYLLTPRDLTKWVRGLLRYELSSEQVLDCVAYEVRASPPHTLFKTADTLLCRYFPRASFSFGGLL